MISVEVVGEISRLLNEQELSQRAIADKLGVSRGTVNAIASGRRELVGRMSIDPASGRACEALPSRCRACGGLVYKPCLLCEARALNRERRRRHARLANLAIRPEPRRRVA